MTRAQLADLFEILSETFLEPGADLREPLGRLLASRPGGALEDRLRRMAGAVLDPESQAVEYARLFLHSREADVVHLYESVQARGHLMAPDILDPLKALYDAADLSVREGLGVPPDHLGLELACLAYLLRQAEEAPEARDLALTLVREHLAPLADAVAAQLPRIQPHPYFQAAADLAREGVAEAGRALS